MKIDYEQWVFSNLLNLYDEDFRVEEYDLAWEQLHNLYEEFLSSKFNVDTKSAIDCMHEFLNNKYN
jgi:hypothetical protein